MPISERAKQFMPFDALKGLKEALRLKEYKHEKIQMGDLPEEEIEEISKILSSLKKGDSVNVSIFDDGYIKNISGIIKLDLEKKSFSIENQTYLLEQLIKINKM